jgi:signal transduction histidine kinase
MAFLPVPQDRLQQFKELLGLATHNDNPLAKWASVFLPRATELANHIEDFVRSRPQLRIILENQPSGKLNKNWRSWLTLIFTVGVGDDFMNHVWMSGQAHVIHNVDHRYVNLAYNIARAFLHQTAMASLAIEEQPPAITAIDRAVDFSLLVETDAFVTYATQCELEVIQGISHQVRNPVSIIGGSARRLMRLHPEDDASREAAEVILSEAIRLEHMAKNVNAYMDITQHQAAFKRAELAAIIERAADKVQPASPVPDSAFQVFLSPEADVLSGDPTELCILFACLLENAFQYADPSDPNVSVTSVPSPTQDGFAVITIINNGVSFDQDKMAQAFSPFHSTQPTATGFGLPMARVIASKYFGNITLAPLDGHGTRCVVTLPLYTRKDLHL